MKNPTIKKKKLVPAVIKLPVHTGPGKLKKGCAELPDGRHEIRNADIINGEVPKLLEVSV